MMNHMELVSAWRLRIVPETRDPLSTVYCVRKAITGLERSSESGEQLSRDDFKDYPYIYRHRHRHTEPDAEPDQSTLPLTSKT